MNRRQLKQTISLYTVIFIIIFGALIWAVRERTRVDTPPDNSADIVVDNTPDISVDKTEPISVQEPTQEPVQAIMRDENIYRCGPSAGVVNIANILFDRNVTSYGEAESLINANPDDYELVCGSQSDNLQFYPISNVVLLREDDVIVQR